MILQEAQEILTAEHEIAHHGWTHRPPAELTREEEEAELVRFTEFFGPCETTVRKDIQSPYHDEIIYFSTLKYSDGRFVGGFAGGEPCSPKYPAPLHGDASAYFESGSCGSGGLAAIRTSHCDGRGTDRDGAVAPTVPGPTVPHAAAHIPQPTARSTHASV